MEVADFCPAGLNYANRSRQKRARLLMAYRETKTPSRFSRKGVSCIQSGLELVDEVQRQRDGIALVRSTDDGSGVRLVAAHAVVPTELSTADHVRPQRVIGGESQGSEPVLQVFEAVVTPIVERPVSAFGVITADVELPLLIGLEGGVAGKGVGPGLSSQVCQGCAWACEAIIKSGTHGQSFNRSFQAAACVKARGIV